MSTTLNDFNAKIQEIREKIKNESNTPQKNQALLQFLKEHCARTLEIAKMDAEFEETVKTELMKIESELGQLKRKGFIKPSVSPSKPIPATSTTPTTPEKLDFKPGTELSPSDFAPISDSNDVWQNVPVSSFDPSSSPILRRLLNKQPIVDTKAIPSPVSNPTLEAEPAAKSQVVQKEKVESPKAEPKTEPKAPSPVPEPIKVDQLAPFPNSPFPSSSNNKPIIPRKPITLEIPQLKIKMELPFTESIIALGREDFEKSTQTMKLPPDFFSPMLNKKIIPSSGPSEHFAIEQLNPSEFFLKDRANLQKTFFKNAFVNDQGLPIKDGENFILPVLINNQMASLTVIFRIKP